MAAKDQWGTEWAMEESKQVQVHTVSCAACPEVLKPGYSTIDDTRLEFADKGWQLVPGIGWVCRDCYSYTPDGERLDRAVERARKSGEDTTTVAF